MGKLAFCTKDGGYFLLKHGVHQPVGQGWAWWHDMPLSQSHFIYPVLTFVTKPDAGGEFLFTTWRFDNKYALRSRQINVCYPTIQVLYWPPDPAQKGMVTWNRVRTYNLDYECARDLLWLSAEEAKEFLSHVELTVPGEMTARESYILEMWKAWAKLDWPVEGGSTPDRWCVFGG